MKEKILENNGILLSTFNSSSQYDCVIKCMEEYLQFQLKEYKNKLINEIDKAMHTEKESSEEHHPTGYYLGLERSLIIIDVP